MTDETSRRIVVEWEDISPSLAMAATHSGLDYMQALVDGKAPGAPIAALMGFSLREVSERRAVFIGTPGEQHFNPMGMVHGGYASTLLDSALGCAVHTTLPAGMGYGTAQLNVNLTRPILPDVGVLVCEAQVLHRGSRMATAEATVKDSRGKLYAHGTATCFLFALSGA